MDAGFYSLHAFETSHIDAKIGKAGGMYQCFFTETEE